MRLSRSLLVAVGVLPALAACGSSAREQLRVLAHADSLRQDSLVSIRNELLQEVMTSTQFVNDINAELAKARTLKSGRLSTTLSTESDVAQIREERATTLAKIAELSARLDSAEARIASTRARAASLARHDKTLMAQVAAYEKTIADLRAEADRQRAEFQAVIEKQNVQIAALRTSVDTLTRTSVRLAGERTALADTVSQLTTERNTVFYVVGTKEELVRSRVLVEEGRRRFLLLGGRPVAPARELDTAKFTRIDRLRDRTIPLPDGEYTILSRHNPGYASSTATDAGSAPAGRFRGGLHVEQPERFWSSSKFLILVRS